MALVWIVVVLVVLGIGYEQWSRYRVSREIYQGKTFASIKGKRVHYIKKGTGDQTIVFVSGLGGDHTIWKDIQEELSADAVTISYDRAGLFLSDVKKGYITNYSITRELEQLLDATDCPRPYLLVCHSMAAIYMRSFISRNSDDIAGVVFAEAAHPLQMKRSSPQLLKALAVPPIGVMRLLVASGLFRLLFKYKALSAEAPIEHSYNQNFCDHFYRSYITTFKEAANDKVNLEDAEHSTGFGDIPLVVITGTSAIRTAGIKDVAVKKEYHQLVWDLHHDYLNLSTQSKFVEAKNSGHLLQVTEPEIVVREVREMMGLIR